MYYIGIDLGGTNVAAGIVDGEGALLSKASVPCPRGAEPIADAIAMDIPLKKTKGSMIVNIGAQSTEISVIADGKVIMDVEKYDLDME